MPVSIFFTLSSILTALTNGESATTKPPFPFFEDFLFKKNLEVFGYKPLAYPELKGNIIHADTVGSENDSLQYSYSLTC